MTLHIQPFEAQICADSRRHTTPVTMIRATSQMKHASPVESEDPALRHMPL